MAVAVALSGVVDVPDLSTEFVQTLSQDMVSMAQFVNGVARLSGLEPGTYTILAIIYDQAAMTAGSDPFATAQWQTSVVEVEKSAGETRITVEVAEGVPVRVVYKGSIAIDGISLTVASTDSTRFTVALIPYTLDVTNLGELEVGDRVNLEMDPIGRWVETLLIERGHLPSAAGEDR